MQDSHPLYNLQLPFVWNRSPRWQMFVFLALLSAAFIAGWKWRRAGHFPAPLPPGPPADSLIGHTRIFPQKNLESVFREWSLKYGALLIPLGSRLA